MKTKTFQLTDKELKLLMMILEESQENRSDMGCNDPYEEEKNYLQKKKELK